MKYTIPAYHVITKLCESETIGIVKGHSPQEIIEFRTFNRDGVYASKAELVPIVSMVKIAERKSDHIAFHCQHDCGLIISTSKCSWGYGSHIEMKIVSAFSSCHQPGLLKI